jgi:hypothetical protein
MALNNLRIITTNLVTGGTLSTTSTTVGGNIQNLKNDKKSSIWRASGTSAEITLTISNSKFGGIVFPFCNLSTTATVKVFLNGATLDQNATVLNKAVCPWDRYTPTNWGSIPANLNTYSYGGGTYAVCWIPAQPYASTIRIVISDPANTAGYLEFSNLIIGEYWSPTYNTSYGLNTGITDSSIIDRSESGNLMSCRKPSFRTMRFNLDWLNTADRLAMQKLIQGAGKSATIFISLFPEEGTNLENYHQIYGKQTQLNNISYSNYAFYASSIDVEEV